MILFDIPDIRLFAQNDLRFLGNSHEDGTSPICHPESAQRGEGPRSRFEVQSIAGAFQRDPLRRGGSG
jgi:hypothetical protein